MASSRGTPDLRVPLPPSTRSQKGILKLRNILEGDKDEENFNPEEYINLYTCASNPPLPSLFPLDRRSRS
jgi:hypothetical protein